MAAGDWRMGKIERGWVKGYKLLVIGLIRSEDLLITWRVYLTVLYNRNLLKCSHAPQKRYICDGKAVLMN